MLFMDDQEAILRMAERLVKRMGIGFDKAVSGEQAIECNCDPSTAGMPFDLESYRATPR